MNNTALLIAFATVPYLICIVIYLTLLGLGIIGMG